MAAVCSRVFSQTAARVLVEPTARLPGFWFGAGSVFVHGGQRYVLGRYRDHGDSRFALELGVRGRELAVFAWPEDGELRKVLAWGKAQLGADVISIEGSDFFATDSYVYVLVSSEKQRAYPDGLQEFQKPQTGVWSIDYICAKDVAGLAHAPVRSLLVSHDAEHLHVKDPYVLAVDGASARVIFCVHSFSWTEGHSGMMTVQIGADGTLSVGGDVAYDIFPRGRTWDVATARITGGLDVSALTGTRKHAQGEDADRAHTYLLFYDGAESFLPHPQSERGVQRARGYCCEEIGGALVGPLHALQRVSRLRPLMVSPHSTGCSRYHRVCIHNGTVIATWQQSAPDGSQPLVYTQTPLADVVALLAAQE